MKIEITAKSLEITDALRNTIQEKFDHHFKRHAQVKRAHVVIEVHKQNQIVKAHLHIPGADIDATSESKNMYDSIDRVVDKLITQINKHEDKTTDHHKHHEHKED